MIDVRYNLIILRPSVEIEITVVPIHPFYSLSCSIVDSITIHFSVFITKPTNKLDIILILIRFIFYCAARDSAFYDIGMGFDVQKYSGQRGHGVCESHTS